MHELLTKIKEIVDYIAIFFMIWGLFQALIRIVVNEFKIKDQEEQTFRRDQIRIFLGTYILLGLEILLLADIIGTIVNPTLNELLTLITIVVVRTVISFFLQRDIKDAAHEVELRKLNPALFYKGWKKKPAKALDPEENP